MDTTQPPFVRALVRVLAKAALAIAGLLDRRLDLGLALIVASVALDVIEEWTDRKPISDPKPTSDVYEGSVWPGRLSCGVVGLAAPGLGRRRAGELFLDEPFARLTRRS